MLDSVCDVWPRRSYLSQSFLQLMIPGDGKQTGLAMRILVDVNVVACGVPVRPAHVLWIISPILHLM